MMKIMKMLEMLSMLKMIKMLKMMKLLKMMKMMKWWKCWNAEMMKMMMMTMMMTTMMMTMMMMAMMMMVAVMLNTSFLIIIVFTFIGFSFSFLFCSSACFFWNFSLLIHSHPLQQIVGTFLEIRSCSIFLNWTLDLFFCITLISFEICWNDTYCDLNGLQMRIENHLVFYLFGIAQIWNHK